MKFFPSTTVVARWNEPAAYSYTFRGKRLGRIIVTVAVIGVVFFGATQRHGGTVWFALVPFVALGLPYGLLQLHRRWPKIVPLTGLRVTLYDDRISRQGGRSSTSTALDHISACTVTRGTDEDGTWTRLSFTTRSSLWDGLAETAISDSGTARQVIDYLRARGVTIMDVGAAGD